MAFPVLDPDLVRKQPVELSALSQLLPTRSNIFSFAVKMNSKVTAKRNVCGFTKTHMAHRETCRIQGSEIPSVRFDRIEQSLIRRRDTEWSSGGSVFQASREERCNRLQRSCVLATWSVLRQIASPHKVGNVRFICWIITLPLQLFYYLRDCFKEICYQSDVCYLEYGSIWVLQDIITSEQRNDMRFKKSPPYLLLQ